MRTCEIAIIGSGPAGIAAAVQLKRYGIDIALFEKESVGGLIRNANRIENYPGFPDGLSGTRFVYLLEEHLQRFGVETINENIENLCLDGDSFTLRSENGLTKANRVIIASGTIPIQLPSPHIPGSLTDKIPYEVYSLNKIKDHTIAIIGGGDAAFDYALNLAKHNKVSILIRDSKAKCLPLLLKRSEVCDRIRIHYYTEVESIEESADGMLLKYRNTDRDSKFELQADNLLIAIGRKPNLDFIDDKLRDRMNDLIDDAKLYMIGDVANELFRQAAIAAGDGVRAAMKIFEALKGERV